MKIKNPQATLLDGLRLLDGLVLLTTGWATHVWRFELAGMGGASLSPLHSQLMIWAGLAGVLGATMMVRQWHHSGLWGPMRDAFNAWLVAWMLVLAWLVFNKQADDTSRLWLGAWAGASLASMVVLRWGYQAFSRRLNRAYWATRRVLVVGSGERTGALLRGIEQQASYRIAHEHLPQEHIHQLPGLLADLNPDEVWLCLDAAQMSELPALLEQLADSTADVKLVADMQTMGLLNHGVSDLCGVAALDLSDSPMSDWNNQALKWMEDKVLALVALAVFGPLMVVIALAVKLTSPGPVLYRQKRDGWNGEVVEVYKFRSMHVHDEAAGRVTQACRGDARVTPLGRVLRSTSLDELPQLFNVLQGRMSLVGPRPHAMAHNRMYRSLIPRYMLRHKVKPGITGWAQVNGLRGETDTLDKMEQRVRADLFYIENWSLWLDLRILLLTVVRGFVSRNAF